MSVMIDLTSFKWEGIPMNLADNWPEYERIDAGNGEKLERWGDVRLLRPDPQAIWPMRAPENIHARYIRSSSGGGSWENYLPMRESWTIHYGEMRFKVRPTGFKHTGLFPEQAVNWDWMHSLIANAGREIKVLNLFAYTGAATCACAHAGAHVVLVHAAKGMVHWAKENLALCGLQTRPVRFIVDDVAKFVQREIRRGNHYDGILMDPPSYGRGPNGEMWKIEESLYPLVESCAALLSDEPLFFLINSYTTGLAASVLGNILKTAINAPGKVEADEVGLPLSGRALVLPCGASGRWQYGRA
jgi:23S rRNA (cytosine1962-C5)-methyltransferase